MSTTTAPQSDPCAYRDCETTVHAHEAVEGSYCSQACYYREVGAGLLGHLTRRHEICGTCFRLTKDIERPPAEYLRTHFRRSGVGWTLAEDGEAWTVERWGQELSREAVVGFAQPTEHATPGAFGLECRCGAIDHDIDDQDVRDLTSWEWWLQLATEYLRDIGARETTVTAATVGHAYWRTGDMEFAVGLALDV